MNKFWRNALCIFVGFWFGWFGYLLTVIFWPLLFPASLQGASLGETVAPLAIVAFFLLFGVIGFRLCRRLTRKYARDSDSITGLFH
jgi:hypothetical protein